MYATFEVINSTRGFNTYTLNGEWIGFETVEVGRNGDAALLYEVAYNHASVAAAAHGARLEVFRAE